MQGAPRPKTLRSPSFPFIGLREAVDRARVFYEVEHRSPARPEVAAARWGYSAKSSGANQTVAALRAYGLLEGKGALRLTELAVSLLNEEDHSAERIRLLRDAALHPEVHSKLWEKYGPGLPPDNALASFLTLDLGFNPKSVADFVRSYRETLTFAKLRDCDEAGANATLRPPLPSPPDLTLGLPLLNGNRAEFRVLRKIDPVEAEQLRQVFELWLQKIVEVP